MTQARWTRDQVVTEAKKRTDVAIYMNALDIAMQEETFEDAIETLVCESEYMAHKAP